MLIIDNDPIRFILLAVNEIRPDLKANIQANPNLRGEEFKECGCTIFPDDGGIPLVEFSTKIPYEAVPEILAHELAHVMEPNDEHGPKWESTFEAIHDKYREIIKREFGIED